MTYPTAAEFVALLEKLQAFFAAEPAAVSVETERFGTIYRSNIDHVLEVARRSASLDATSFTQAEVELAIAVVRKQMQTWWPADGGSRPGQVIDVPALLEAELGLSAPRARGLAAILPTVWK